jgi:excisionase family DNA binding protein
MNPEQKTFTLTQLSEYLGIPKRTVYDMIRDGRFDVEPIKMLTPRRWNKESIDKWRLGKK